MERLTRVKDEYECRMNGCPAEEWMSNHYYDNSYPSGVICEDCPFMMLVNKLAEYEDKEA